MADFTISKLIHPMAGFRQRFAFFEPLPKSGHEAAAKVDGTT